MLKIVLISLVATTAACRLAERERPVKIHRPSAERPNAPVPNEKGSQIPGDPDADADSNPAIPSDPTPTSPETISRDGNPENDNAGSVSQKIERYSSENLTVTSGNTDSLSTFQFAGADARIIYKLLGIERQTVTGSTAAYHYIKKGENIACERYVMADNTTQANYRCKMDLNSESGEAQAATDNILTGAPDESLTSSFSGQFVAIAPSNVETVGTVTITGPDATALMKNLGTDEIAGKKVGAEISCLNTSGAAVCTLQFRYDTGKILPAS